MTIEEKPVRIEELVEVLGVSERTIATWLKMGLPVHKVVRLNFFYWSEVNQWIKENDESDDTHSR